MTQNTIETPESILKTCIQGLNDSPGIYRFYNQQRELLYVGKARSLKKRVTSYLRKQSSDRINTLISQIAHIEVTLTQTENEALLLESNLIKILKPHYNILLRDDKTYPYLVLSNHEHYPRLYAYRGKPKGQAKHFGPYPSIIAMRESLNLLQKIFKLRSCRDPFFKNRTRPCLQYQIKRCTAPCVGFITPDAYQKDVDKVRLFLQGKSTEVIQQLTQHMETASSTQNYEKANHLLEKITYLRQIQQQQTIITSTTGSIDVIAWTAQADLHCIYVLPIRQGQIVGGQPYFPKIPSLLTNKATILSEFIAQFYIATQSSLPEEIVIDTRIDDQTWLSEALSTKHATSILIRHRPNKTQLEWLHLAYQNAKQSLAYELQTQQRKQAQRHALQQILTLPRMPERLECFDISHSHGEATVASCVVFDQEGPCKKDYRRFNIKNILPGDDYAAIKQAIHRRYSNPDTRPLPDILIIDGGKGQLTQAVSVLTELQLHDKIRLIAIAKGPARKAGYETLFLTEQKLRLTLSPDDPLLHLLQQIRDEAHRFAITGHRKQRAKRRKHSILESIPGIGPQRRRHLLTRFGGLQGLQQASISELHQVPSINLKLAESIYASLHK